MLSIDKIKFGLLFNKNTLYNLDYSDRTHDQYYIEGHKQPWMGTFKVSNKKLRDEEREGKHFLFFYINFYNQEYFKDNVWVDLHLNKFIYSSFNEYEVAKRKIFRALYKLIAEIFDVEGINDRKVTITDIHSSKDLMLKYNPKYYLDILKYLRFSRYYTYPNVGNNTITIHRKKELENLSFKKKKASKLAEVYDKSRKFRFRGVDVNGLNILRFEYEMKGQHRRDIGIKRRQFPLSHIYDIPWADYMKKYLFKKYLNDEYVDVDYKELGNGHDKNQEKKWADKFGNDPLEHYSFNEFKARLEEEYSSFKYGFRRFYDVFLKKSLKEKHNKINSNGLTLYKELYTKAYDMENFEDQIPNVNQIYLN